MRLLFADIALEQLQKLSHDTHRRIIKKLRFFAEQREPLKFAKRLTDVGDGEYRFRVGGYRIRFDVKDNTIFVIKIGPRDKIYD